MCLHDLFCPFPLAHQLQLLETPMSNKQAHAPPTATPSPSTIPEHHTLTWCKLGLWSLPLAPSTSCHLQTSISRPPSEQHCIRHVNWKLTECLDLGLTNLHDALSLLAWSRASWTRDLHLSRCMVLLMPQVWLGALGALAEFTSLNVSFSDNLAVWQA